MFYRLRQRSTDEGGFTLIELLVVILIIGILAAIAIPAFLSQTSKASDSAAKTQVGTLQTTMESFATENNGSYLGAEIEKLRVIEPTLKDESQTIPKVESATATGFKVESEVKSTKNKYFLENNAGTITRTCEVASASVPGGCKELVGTKGTW